MRLPKSIYSLIAGLMIFSAGFLVVTPKAEGSDIINFIADVLDEFKKVNPATPFDGQQLRASAGLIECLADAGDDLAVAKCIDSFVNTPVGEKLTAEAGKAIGESDFPSWLKDTLELYILIREGDVMAIVLKFGETILCAVAQAFTSVDICGILETLKSFVQLGQALYDVFADVVDFFSDLLGGDDGPKVPEWQQVYNSYFASMVTPDNLYATVRLRSDTPDKFEAMVSQLVNELKNMTYTSTYCDIPRDDGSCAGGYSESQLPSWTPEAIKKASDDFKTFVESEWTKEVIQGGVLKEYMKIQDDFTPPYRLAAQGVLEGLNPSPEYVAQCVKGFNSISWLNMTSAKNWIAKYPDLAKPIGAQLPLDWCRLESLTKKEYRPRITEAFSQYIAENLKCKRDAGGAITCPSPAAYDDCKTILATVNKGTLCTKLSFKPALSVTEDKGKALLSWKDPGSDFVSIIEIWKKGPGDADFKVFRRSHPVKPSSISDGPLYQGLPYVYRARFAAAIEGDQPGEWSDEKTITLAKAKATNPPNSPAIVSLEQMKGLPQVTFKWTYEDGVDRMARSYAIYRDYEKEKAIKVSEKTFDKPVVEKTTFVYDDKLPSKSGRYGYRVVVSNDAGESDAGQSITIKLPSLMDEKPIAPNNLKATLPGDKTVVLTWIGPIQADSYTILVYNEKGDSDYYEYRPGSGASVKESQSGKKEFSFTDKFTKRFKYEPGKTFKYMVNAKRPDGTSLGATDRVSVQLPITSVAGAQAAVTAKDVKSDVNTEKVMDAKPDLTAAEKVTLSGKTANWGGSITVDAKDATRMANDLCEFAVQYTVKNTGGAAAGKFKTAWGNTLVPASPLEKEVSGIAAGGSLAQTETLKLKPGANVLRLMIDPTSQVTESNENNNNFSVTLNLTGQCSPLAPAASGQSLKGMERPKPGK